MSGNGLDLHVLVLRFRQRALVVLGRTRGDGENATQGDATNEKAERKEEVRRRDEQNEEAEEQYAYETRRINSNNALLYAIQYFILCGVLPINA